MRYCVVIFILWLAPIVLKAQCAMCRATVENSVKSGEGAIATGLNVGILYLFLAPYFFLGIVAFFWYRSSRKK